MIKKTILSFALWFVASFISGLVILWVIYLVNGGTGEDFINQLPSILGYLVKNPLFWITLNISYLLYKLVRYWIISFEKGKFRLLGKRLLFTVMIPSLIIFSVLQIFSWYQTSESYKYQRSDSFHNLEGKSQQYSDSDDKLRGMHLFGRRSIDSLKITELTRANIEQVILVPYSDQEDYNTPLRKLSDERLVRRDSAYSSIIKTCEKLGVEVIIKPHIWIFNPSEGKWRADIWMESEEDWIQWESTYTRFILHYAKLSEQFNLPLFCIGNEYSLMTTNRPDFWRNLIKQVREVYSGELTYGANWDREYKELPFWEDLDYIGIQAYFPLTDHEHPEYEQVQKGWDNHLKEIKQISEKHDRKVIFTELGYKSTPDAAQYPWAWEDFVGDQFDRISNKTQHYCYQAFFDRVWSQPWFSGVMIWQWQASDDGKTPNHNFTIYGKPAFDEVAKGFKLKDL